MNKVILIGRLTSDPEFKYVGGSQSALAEFTLAVDRKFKSLDGTRKTDFIKIESWEKRAELCNQFLKKGQLISLEGSLNVDKYKTESGENRTITKVRLTSFEFLSPKNDYNKEKNVINGKDIFKENEICVDIAEEDIPF